MRALKIFIHSFLVILILQSTWSCTPEKNPDQTTYNSQNMKIKDIHSFADPTIARGAHLDWTATVDFENQIITGKAKWQIEKAPDAEKIIFDTRNLTIEKVTLDGNDSLVDFELIDGEEEFMGSALHIPLRQKTQTVTIHYSTSEGAEALQWLTPEQTAGKKHPFLFTQSQAILARTWIPVQDSPGLRFTYNAEVKVPAGLMALMSASNPKTVNPEGKYAFEMNQPIPAYLMALAVGNLEFESVGARSGVYAEPELIDASAYEFAEMEDMLTVCEALYGPYRWERHDLIVLPPSFPFGGMENPRLTFATPTILAGDRSLTSLVAHEIAHSWSGNLVTNATWNDFWLNEGFTVYFERRIMEAMYGESYAEMLAELGKQDLQRTIVRFKQDDQWQDTKLKLELSGRNPDDGVTDIPYEKGYFFLRYLESLVGRDQFDQFLRKYFDEHAFETINTEAFIEYAGKKLAEGIEIDRQLLENWIYEPGLPQTMPVVESERFNQVDQQLELWKSGTAATELRTSKWSSHEWLHFIRNLPEQEAISRLEELDQAFGFTDTGNSEMLAAWLIYAINHNYQAAYQSLENFLSSVGRRKFLQPIYESLAKTEDGKALALSIYRQARKNYHSVAINTIDSILEWNQDI